MTEPNRDQQQAHVRDLLSTLTGNDDRVFLDRSELAQLVQSNASGDEIRDYLQARIAEHEQQRQADGG